MTDTVSSRPETAGDTASDIWLLKKRDLYYRPAGSGYTGIRDHAGRYTEELARHYVGDGSSGVSMVRLTDAPEFTGACFDDLARDHLIKQRDELLAALVAALPLLDNSDSPGGCDGKHDHCDHCAVIRDARAAIRKARGASQ